MDIRIFKVREWIDEGALVTTYCNTLSMAADIGTKALGERQFVFCRDLMNGYALVQAGSQQTNWLERDVHLLGRSSVRMS